MPKTKTVKKVKKSPKVEDPKVLENQSMPTGLPYKIRKPAMKKYDRKETNIGGKICHLEVVEEQKPKYKVTLQFNEETFEIKTNNIVEAVTAIKPEVLYTELYITISDGQSEFQKRFNLIQGKRLFASDEMMDVFISTMLF